MTLDLPTPTHPHTHTHTEEFLFVFRCLGRLFVKGSSKPLGILTKLNEFAGFLPNEEIDIFELEDGDIICFQKSLRNQGSEQYRFPEVPSFLEYIHNHQVTRLGSASPNTRDALYQRLPPSTNSALRFKLLSFSLKEKLIVAQIKGEMEKTLQWLVPKATSIQVKLLSMAIHLHWPWLLGFTMLVSNRTFTLLILFGTSNYVGCG